MTGRRTMEKHGDPMDRACDIELEERERIPEERKRSREEENVHQAKDQHGRVICNECSVILPQGRLKAMSYAVYCVGCQEQGAHTAQTFKIFSDNLNKPVYSSIQMLDCLT